MKVAGEHLFAFLLILLYRRAMVSRRRIESFVEQVAEEFSPERVVLFGSYAQDCASEYSDIDLVVIAPEFDGSRELSLIKNLWQATVADNRIEPIPCGEREWEIDQSRPIIEIARREGVVITP